MPPAPDSVKLRNAKPPRGGGRRLIVLGVISLAVTSAHPQDVGHIPTFHQDVAPLLRQNCCSCHQPGASAPFPLVTYSDARRHAAEIVEMTQRRAMPPWLPEPGCAKFVDERVLSSEQIARLKLWSDEGMAEGSPTPDSSGPPSTNGWRLGPPDLVVTMEEPYLLAADGKDVYRNFVVAIPLNRPRYVKGVEFHPGNPRVVHHAFVNLDPTRKSRGKAAETKPPSFGGMELPETAFMPGGQMLGWQPGKAPYFSPDGLSWTLNPGSDLVLQLHMHPSGKTEPVQASISFYFTDIAPTNSPFRLELVRYDLNIPAGSTNYTVEHAYALPVDVQLLGISPHTHYLGKELEGYAVLPDGERRCLLRIPDWDFNWQGDYRFAEPIFLPKNTTLHMRFRFDNSTHNIRNPNHPPKDVVYGLQTTDEMAELWFQVLPGSRADGMILGRDYTGFRRRFLVTLYENRLRTNPDDGEAHLKLGSVLQFVGRNGESMNHFVQAARLLPLDDKAHYELGYQYLLSKRYPEAAGEFEVAVRLNPRDHQAFGCLGVARLGEGNQADARRCFEAALRLNPDDTLALKYLGQLKAGQ